MPIAVICLLKYVSVIKKICLNLSEFLIILWSIKLQPRQDHQYISMQDIKVPKQTICVIKSSRLAYPLVLLQFLASFR